MAFLSRNLILDLLLTALAPAIWGTTYIVTSSFCPLTGHLLLRC